MLGRWYKLHLPGTDGPAYCRKLPERKNGPESCELRVGSWLWVVISAEYLRQMGAQYLVVVDDETVERECSNMPCGTLVRMPTWPYPDTRDTKNIHTRASDT